MWVPEDLLSTPSQCLLLATSCLLVWLSVTTDELVLKHSYRPKSTVGLGIYSWRHPSVIYPSCGFWWLQSDPYPALKCPTDNHCPEHCPVHAESLQSWSTDPVDCGPPGSSVHRIIPTRTLEWVATLSSGGPPDPGTEPTSLISPALVGGLFTTRTTWKLCIFPWVHLFLKSWQPLTFSLSPEFAFSSFPLVFTLFKIILLPTWENQVIFETCYEKQQTFIPYTHSLFSEAVGLPF